MSFLFPDYIICRREGDLTGEALPLDRSCPWGITVREVYQFWRLEEPIKGLRDSRTIPLFIIQDGLTIRLHEEIWDKMRENRAFTFVFFRPDPQSAQPQLLPQSISAPAAQSAMMTMMMTSAVRRSPRPRNDNGGDWLLGYGDMNVREKV
ncbi:hypothetical protein FRC20_006560 [Serendipita sp. 405]|nr:hypothetical protein FRC15_006155 [Serendipita sp. 397]KAG8798870.1 hypothetical protein FRC16_006386 [Serendipita sp. 398]KAG8867160.1 hypothetical protein FRC20_006560 [Serendipita sp. 405]